jgi:DNA-directed RNA polymerase I subunit RPA2
MSRSGLLHKKEEANEFGGFFICNGIERIIRMLVQTRRHYIMALKRGAYHKRGPAFTDLATLIRCVKPDESSLTNRAHYLSDGSVVFAITIRRAEYFIPAGILLKCFLEASDKEIYERLVAGASTEGGHQSFVAERAELLLRQAGKYGLKTKAQCLEYLGSMFRVALDVPEHKSDYETGEHLLSTLCFIHLDSPSDKAALAIQMFLKLYALANGQCCEDNPDALTHHEVLLPGHLLLKFMKEQLEVNLDTFKGFIKRELEKEPASVNMHDEAYVRKAADKMQDVGQRFEYLLNTGNLVSRSGLDLSQATGFTVVAEKLNFYR